MPLKSCITIRAFALLLMGWGWGQAGALDTGWVWFHKCIRGEVDSLDLPASLDSARFYFTRARQDSAAHEQATVGLLRTMLLQGNHTDLSKAEKQKLYAEAKDMGASAKKRHPQSLELIYWYVACLGSWAQEYGVLKAAREGVAGQVKEAAEILITKGDEDKQAKGHRILGRTHHEAPYIPILLNWPSDEEAVRHLEISNRLQPGHPVTLFFLAEAYLETKQKDKALKILRETVAMQPRSHAYLPDKRRIEDCQKLLAELEKK